MKESPGVNLIPFVIPLHLGEMDVKFRVSCSMNYYQGAFII